MIHPYMTFKKFSYHDIFRSTRRITDTLVFEIIEDERLSYYSKGTHQYNFWNKSNITNVCHTSTIIFIRQFDVVLITFLMNMMLI